MNRSAARLAATLAKQMRGATAEAPGRCTTPYVPNAESPARCLSSLGTTAPYTAAIASQKDKPKLRAPVKGAHVLSVSKPDTLQKCERHPA